MGHSLPLKAWQAKLIKTKQNKTPKKGKKRSIAPPCGVQKK